MNWSIERKLTAGLCLVLAIAASIVLVSYHTITGLLPVHIVSELEERQRGLQLGAIAYLQKPASQEDLTAALTNIQKFVERSIFTNCGTHCQGYEGRSRKVSIKQVHQTISPNP